MQVQDQRQASQASRVTLLAGLLSCLMGLATATAPAIAAAPPTAGYVVAYRESAVNRQRSVDDITSRLGGRLGFRTLYRYEHAVKGFAARLTTAQVDRLEASRDVAIVTRNRSLRALQTVPSATGVARISIGTAETGPSSVGVAVLDSGIDLAHPDLNAENGVNCVDGGAGPATDDNGHGTHVAGIIGAKEDGRGVAGVVPGTRVVAVKSLDSRGEGDLFQAVCAINWVAANAGPRNIRVANLSFGYEGPTSTCGTDVLHRAICNASSGGVLFTAATNNSGIDVGGSTADVPAWFPQVFAVTAMSDTDGRPGGVGGAPSCDPGELDDVYATFSGFATSPTDAGHMIAAPGVCIASTMPGGGYSTESGTSMAAPLVAGVVAACLGRSGASGPCSGLDPAAIIQKLRADAAHASTPANGFVGDPYRPVLNRYYGHLVSLAESTRPPPPPARPATPLAAPKIVLKVSGTPRRQKLRRLYVSVTVNRPGTVTGTGAIGRLRLKRLTRSAVAGRAIRLRMRLTTSRQRRATRMLRRGRRLTARIKIQFTAPDRASATARRTVRLS